MRSRPACCFQYPAGPAGRGPCDLFLRRSFSSGSGRTGPSGGDDGPIPSSGGLDCDLLISSRASSNDLYMGASSGRACGFSQLHLITRGASAASNHCRSPSLTSVPGTGCSRAPRRWWSVRRGRGLLVFRRGGPGLCRAGSAGFFAWSRRGGRCGRWSRRRECLRR